MAATALHRRLMEPGSSTLYAVRGLVQVGTCLPEPAGADEELVASWDVISNVKQPNNLSDLRFCVKHQRGSGRKLDADATMTSLGKMFAGDSCWPTATVTTATSASSAMETEVTGIAPVA